MNWPGIEAGPPQCEAVDQPPEPRPYKAELGVMLRKTVCLKNTLNTEIHARFVVLPALWLKIEVFWDVTPCRCVNNYRRFEGW